MADPLEELRKISASERAETHDELAGKAKAEAKAREKERREAEARIADGRTPPGFFRTARFFYTVMAGVVLAALISSAYFEDDWWNGQIVAGIAGAWALVLALFALDAAAWRRLLPFKLEGFESIAGDDESGEGRVPYLFFDVHLRFAGEGSNEARNQTLEILATRVNRALQKDGEIDATAGRLWRVVEGGSVRGEGSPMLYTDRLLEKWLRKEVRLLHRAFPLAAVTVKAKYTGKSFEVSSD